MVFKKIKKGALTLTGLVVTIILVIGMFSAGFLYLNNQVKLSGITVDSKYNDTYNRLETSQDNLDDNIHDIKTNVEGIKEAETTFQVAWNGLKGLGNTLKLPINFVSTAIDTASAMLIPLDVVPPKYKSLMMMGLIAAIVFLILAILKGEPKL